MLHKKRRFLTILCATAMMFFACRKTTIEKQINLADTPAQRFFNAHRTANPEEKQIIEYLYRIEKEKLFIKATTKRIGYPIWDKMIKYAFGMHSNSVKLMTTGSRIQSGTVQDAYDLYLIPFVRDSQNYVNASMVIKASRSDTSISYICDWQYRNLPSVEPDGTRKRDNFATFFMFFNKVVFGHADFKVTDQQLFKTDRFPAVHVSLEMRASGEKQVNYQVEVCADVVVEYRKCPFISSQGYCYGTNGSCDGCPQCPLTTRVDMHCWTEWVDLPFGGGGGGNGGGSGSPGDSGGGGSPIPPNPCDPGGGGGGAPASIGAVAEYKPGPRVNNAPCDSSPGWYPYDPYSQENLDSFAGSLDRYWEDPTYDNVPFPAYDPGVDGQRDAEGFRKNGAPYQYKDGTVQNYTDDNGHKFALFTDASNGTQVKFPGATITDFGVLNGAGVTTANGGIHLSTSKNGIEDMQHEYGHYLQALVMGAFKYYTTIVPASLKSATLHPNQHRFFWTEVDANQKAVLCFGSSSAIALSTYYPK